MATINHDYQSDSTYLRLCELEISCSETEHPDGKRSLESEIWFKLKLILTYKPHSSAHISVLSFQS